MPTYRYMCRPPGIGCQPDGFDPDTREMWLPAKEIDGRHFFGRVEYPEPLPMEKIWHFDLWPEDEVERAELTFYREHEDAGWMREHYLEQPVEFLREHADRCRFAAAALVLKEAGHG